MRCLHHLILSSDDSLQCTDFIWVNYGIAFGDLMIDSTSFAFKFVAL